MELLKLIWNIKTSCTLCQEAQEQEGSSSVIQDVINNVSLFHSGTPKPKDS